MDDLVKELMKRADLSEAQANAAARVVGEWLKDDRKRRKLVAAVIASTVGSAVATGAI